MKKNAISFALNELVFNHIVTIMVNHKIVPRNQSLGTTQGAKRTIVNPLREGVGTNVIDTITVTIVSGNAWFTEIKTTNGDMCSSHKSSSTQRFDVFHANREETLFFQITGKVTRTPATRATYDKLNDFFLNVTKGVPNISKLRDKPNFGDAKNLKQ